MWLFILFHAKKNPSRRGALKRVNQINQITIQIKQNNEILFLGHWSHFADTSYVSKVLCFFPRRWREAVKALNKLFNT